MGLFLIGLLAMAAFGGDSNGNKNRKKSKRSYSRRTRRDDSWLDAAWFHDHGYSI